MQTEAWLRGAVAGVIAELTPAAHMLIQSEDELDQATAGLTNEQLWATPGNTASPGFHLRHIAGSIDRLLTYARASALNEQQRAALAAEKQIDPAATRDSLLEEARAAIHSALEIYRHTTRETLLDARSVGRAKLPTTVLGLLYHVAEHTVRHTGQIIATAKILKGT
jgi:DinB family protein